MSGCLLCLHLDLGLKTGFEFKVEVVFVNRDSITLAPAGEAEKPQPQGQEKDQ